MAKINSRIAQMEKKSQFMRWFCFSRFLEGLSDEQLEEIALDWRFPDPLPEPLPWGMSELDRLDRKSLLRRWEKSEHKIASIMFETSRHSEVERRFHVRHGHWPEQSCGPECFVHNKLEAAIVAHKGEFKSIDDVLG
jgi:hypothetical protein